MAQEINGRRYEFLRVDDLDHDGLWLEVWDVTDPAAEVLALGVFHHDPTGRMTVTAHRPEFSFDLLEEAMATARTILPPAGNRACEGGRT